LAKIVSFDAAIPWAQHHTMTISIGKPNLNNTGCSGSKVIRLRGGQSNPGSPDHAAHRGPADFVQRLALWLRRLHRPASEPWLRRAAIQDLQRLGDRQLRDIGIERHEIDAVVDDMLAAKWPDN
jgi:uncharacterized protein YjiS (DUF1127 family)